MIKHIVCWKIKDFAEEKSKTKNLQIMQQMLKSLKNLPMVQKLEVGIASTGIDSSNNDIALVTEFKTIEDLKAYQVHPDHLKVSEFVSKIRNSRTCVDFEF